MSVQASSFAGKESKVNDSPGDEPPPVVDSKVTAPQQTAEQRDIEKQLACPLNELRGMWHFFMGDDASVASTTCPT